MIWVALAVLIAAPFAREAMRRVPDRATAPGQFARLSQGVTHYQWGGPVRGPVVVAIHGLTTPSPLWDDIGARLGRLGYRLLVYDLFGRGFSDAVPGPQDRAFFLRQLTDLLADQGLRDDLTVMGYSMGGSIATAFAADQPERMKRLILLAPGGIDMTEDRFTRVCRRVPGLGDWLHLALVRGRVPFRRKGILPAVLSSRRNMLAEIQEADHRKIRRDGTPVVTIWGDKDGVIPLTALGKLAQWNRAARQEVVKGAAHDLPMSHAAEVTEILRQVLHSE